jgi:uncharacterized membrane protein
MESTTQTTEINEKTNDKTIGIVAYLTIIGLIAAIVLNRENKNAFATYHIRQSLGIAVSGLALAIVGLIPFIGWLISILGSVFIVVLWIIGLVNALNGKEKPVPVLGEKYIEWFQNVQ